MKQNPLFQNVSGNYLFQEIATRVKAFKAKNPDAKVISLGIGDTTQVIHPDIGSGLFAAVEDQMKPETYIGYGPDQGLLELREKIAKVIYNDAISPEDIFISDGAKCDTGRLQILFGQECRIALQDPTYPVYLDTSKLFRTKPITFLPCTPENGFFPDLEQAKEVDVLFLCGPNNPTGTLFSKEELQNIVDFAKKESIILVYDAAYSFFVTNGVRSIYEIPGAKEVAIEVGSFSKSCGFSGIRLGWTTIPETVLYSNKTPVKKDFSRLMATFFNGASIISQKGGIQALSDKGIAAINEQTARYMQNTRKLKNCFKDSGLEIYGGDSIPYLWIRMPGRSSWELFDHLLSELHVVTTPGVGFGPAGEGFIRLSGFAKSRDINEAASRLTAISTI